MHPYISPNCATRIALAFVLCLGAVQPTLADAPEGALSVEAEHLLPTYGNAGPLQPNNYEHASGGVSVYLHHGELVWKPTVAQPGAHVLWVRARSGWAQDHYSHGAQLKLRLGVRDVRMTLVRPTLDYHGDGHNFAWFKSEPINLDRGEVALIVSSAWDWAHVDRLLLTRDQNFEPGPGNITTAMAELGSDLVVWAEQPGISFEPRQPPPAAPPEAKLDLLTVRNGRAYGAIALHNRSLAVGVAHLLVRLPEMRSERGDRLDPAHLSVHRLATTGLRAGLLASDALPKLNELGYLELPPGYSTLLWVRFDLPAETPPGRYTGNLVIEDQASLKGTAVPIALEVSPVTLPERTDLAVFSWWGYPHMPASWWDDQLDHGTNTFKISVQANAIYAFDERGDLTRPLDLSRFDPAIEAVRRGGGYLLLEWNLHVPEPAQLQCRAPGAEPGAALPFMSPAWQRAFTTLMSEATRYAVSKGVPEERVLQYTFDEYLGENFIAVGELIRQAGPGYRIFSDLSADLATYQKVTPYVDVWCPHFKSLDAMSEDGRLAFMRRTGKPIWCYDEGYNQRTDPPFAKFRHKFWRAAAYGLDGCTYWKHQGDRVGTAYYPMHPAAAPVTSRRYEAWALGLEDYKLLAMLKARRDAPGAAALWQEAVDAVAAQPDAPEVADEYRRRIIRQLEAGAATP